MNKCLMMPFFLFSSAIALAGEPIEHVEVTAQKRVQSMQKVPVSMTVLSEVELEKLVIESADEVLKVSPNANATTAAGGMTNYFIRGIGMDDFNLSSIPAVGVYLDDVAIGNTMATGFSLFDLQRIEILKGPQNTLFGKNTTGGAINYYSNNPSLDGDASPFLRLGLGNYRRLHSEAGFDWSAGQNTALRFAAFRTKREGFIESQLPQNDSRYGNLNRLGGKIQLLHQYSDRGSMLFSVRSGRQRQITPVRKAIKPTGSDNLIHLNDFDIFAIDSALINPRNDIDTFSSALNLTHHFNNIIFTSVTSYDKVDSARMDDWGAQLETSRVWAVQTYNSTDTRHFSQELRWLSNDEDSLQWMIGAFYTHDDGNLLQMAYIDPAGPGRPDDTIDDAGQGPLFDRGAWLEQNTKTWSLYGRIDKQINRQLSLDFGLRWTRQQLNPKVHNVGMRMDDPVMPFPLGTFGWYSLGPQDFDVHRDFAGFATRDNFLINNGGPAASAEIDKTFNEWGAKAAVNYEFTSDLLAYVSWSRGYKMGSVNSNPTTAAFTTLLDKVVSPELLTTFEAGFKSEWLGRTLRINGALFSNHWDDYQYYLASNPGPPQLLLATLVNVPEARSEGAELDIIYKAGNTTTLFMTWGWLEGKIINADIDTTGIPEANLASYTSQVTAGNQLTNSPKNNYTAGFSQTFEPDWANIEMVLNYRYLGSHTHQLQGQNNALWLHNFSEAAVGLWEMGIHADFGTQQQYRLSFWGKNLTDKQYCTERNAIPGTDTQTIRLCNQGAPLTFGVDLTLNF